MTNTKEAWKGKTERQKAGEKKLKKKKPQKMVKLNRTISVIILNVNKLNIKR